MTAGATRGQPQNRAGDGVDLFINVIHHKSDFESLIDIFHTECQEARRDQLLGLFRRRIRGQQVPGNLLTQKLVVGFVTRKSVNHIVAIPPRMGHRQISGGTG